jgi:REP element-mobilizing transposase RayT
LHVRRERILQAARANSLARGYFCASVGAVDEETIKHYIERQKWEDEDQASKITAPSEP